MPHRADLAGVPSVFRLSPRRRRAKLDLAMRVRSSGIPLLRRGRPALACLLVLMLAVVPAAARTPLVFAVFAEDDEQLRHALVLTESVRTFAGADRDAPVWVYVPPELAGSRPDLVHGLADLGARVHPSTAPPAALAYPLAAKVFAAARAESAAAGRVEILAWLDEDTVVLQEPREFHLPRRVNLGYRPVMHNRSGTLYAEPVDEFWRRVYERLSVPESAIFPMVTPADSQTIRAYFNAGLLVVRPERGTLRRWAEVFPRLYRDTAIVRICRQDRVRALFLHQAALVGAILGRLERDEMRELSPRYNVPLFFREMYGARREFDSIADVVTLRYDVYFRDPAPDWRERMKGPDAIVAWLTARLGQR
jgi:hypothetical protein